ncbi:MAG: leucine--tRNA ligase [Candidatus Levybacteria bacterium RIFCSPLOWO2_01_FULL_39_10]|nr:MAG: leucine--tRNA ligase [Candidatus Levybacteria bacterium RIFCSPLOWO2_01_FULL_39_10]
MKSKNPNIKFNYLELQNKWNKFWQAQKIYHPDLDSAKNPFYNLMMFPYPSAEGLHVGNMYAFTGSDVFGRFMRMKGKDVFEPIGLDGFGIHSENYALKIGAHPAKQAEISEKRFYEQLHMIGNAYDFERTVETYKPDYYKWTQWLFIRLFKAGLAEKKKAEVNWCPSCKTTLADEQVINKLKVKSEKLKVEASPEVRLGGERGGVCERCETPVEKKELEQWFFRITIYADRLLKGLSRIDWSEKVVLAQKNWIGRSEGARIRFSVLGSQLSANSQSASLLTGQQKTDKLNTENRQQKTDNWSIEVFTTRPDTLFGATFMVLSLKHGIVASLLSSKFKVQSSKLEEVREYVEKSKKKTGLGLDAPDKAKEGVFSGLYAINPATNENIPVWISDYVLMEYGTGAIMAVPGHDRRDFEFAKKYELPIKYVLEKPKSADDKIECWDSQGKIIDSGDWTGWDSEKDFHKILNFLEEKKIGKRELRYHLRDWLISRQRYWGAPIPIIYCCNCWESKLKIKNEKLKIEYGKDYIKIDGKEHAIVPVPEKDLPVVLPFVENFKPLGTGVAPLAQDEEFVNTKCPNCDSPAKRETDVCDTFLDSSWYFLRYLATDSDKVPFPSKSWENPKSEIRNPKQIFRASSFELRASAKRAVWLPVDMYIGGAEHSVLHLLYARFITKALFDLNYLDFDEPFTKFRAHGLLIKDSAKMSKSRGNIVNPDEYIASFGADALRCYLMFLGPYEQGGDFRDSGIEGMERFLKRVKRLVESQSNNVAEQSSIEVKKAVDKAVKGVGEDIESLRYNTAIAKIMTLTNVLYESRGKISKDSLKTYILLLAPFAPFMTEELWERLRLSKIDTDKSADIHGSKNSRKSFAWSVHAQPWPKYDEENITEEIVTIAVQVNGKLRSVLSIKYQVSSREEVESLAREDERVKKYLEGKEIKKVIFVPRKIINFVVNND